MSTISTLADHYRLTHAILDENLLDPPLASFARGLINANNELVLDGDTLAALLASTTALTGSISVADPTTPSVTLATGKTNTGFFLVYGKTSGGFKIITADATGYLITQTTTTQTVGAVTLTIPNFAGVADTYVFTTLAQSLASKTLVAPVISTGLTASGSASNDFSGSTGTFKTSTGLNTVGGKQALKVIATAVAAAGSTTSDAAALGSANIVRISSDSAAKGVKLLAGVAGDIIEIHNTSSTAAILYPATGGTINGLSANAGVLVPASKGTKATCTAADTWTAFDMNSHATAA